MSYWDGLGEPSYSNSRLSMWDKFLLGATLICLFVVLADCFAVTHLLNNHIITFASKIEGFFGGKYPISAAGELAGDGVTALVLLVFIYRLVTGNEKFGISLNRDASYFMLFPAALIALTYFFAIVLPLNYLYK